MSVDHDPVIDSRTKGWPACATAVRLSQVGKQHWNLLKGDLPLPVAVLSKAALANNGRWMRAFTERTGTKLAPHGKTTMSPQLFAMQMGDGAWGLTLATIQQVRVARAAGISRIILANELVSPLDIAWLGEELRAHPELELYCLVDSVEGVRRLTHAGATINVLLEVGYPGGRAGCRSVDAALEVARAVKASSSLRLCGVEGFEGLHQSLPGQEGAAKVKAFLGTMIEVATQIDRDELFAGDEIMLSAGGSTFYDLVCEVFAGARLSRRASVVLRSGCYFTHDAGVYERSFAQVCERNATARALDGRFENALEVWAHVLSVPERGRAIIGAGRRDFGHDGGMPVLLKRFRPAVDSQPSPIAGCEVVAVNDQHAHVKLDAGADLAIGDLVALGVSHPCTTFDKWRLIYLVDDAYSVTSAVETFF